MGIRTGIRTGTGIRIGIRTGTGMGMGCGCECRCGWGCMRCPCRSSCGKCVPWCQRSVGVVPGGRCDAGGAPSSLWGWGAARRGVCQAGYRRCRWGRMSTGMGRGWVGADAGRGGPGTVGT
ncbi:hypothetical protein K438DRAFT_732527 [Mycena galopus ATCC 62051]|nr:hypothetical protein K438DRAFT_732527 [Mycena galopus ATCC 62051]